MTEAKHKDSSHWTVRATLEDKRDDDEGLTFTPAATTQAGYVQQCLAGLLSPTLCEAAQALQAEGGAWLQMTPEQQADAIEARAREIEEDDPDGSKALGRAGAAPTGHSPVAIIADDRF